MQRTISQKRGHEEDLKALGAETQQVSAYPGSDIDGCVRLAPPLRVDHTLPGIHSKKMLLGSHVILGLGEL